MTQARIEQLRADMPWQITDPTVPYVALEGTAAPDVHAELYRRAISSTQITIPHYQAERGQQPDPDGADFHFREDGMSLQIRLRKRGGFRLLGPVPGPTMQWLLAEAENGQVKIKFRREMSAILTLNYAEVYVYQEWRETAVIRGTYTAADREELREFVAHGGTWMWAYLAAHLPPDWQPIPPSAMRSASYRRGIKALIQLLPRGFRLVDSASLEQFVRVRSGWSPDDLNLPMLRMDLSDPKEEAAMADQVAQRMAAKRRSESLFAELFPDPEAIPSGLLFVDHRTVTRTVVDCLPPESLSQALERHGLTREEVTAMLEPPLQSLRYGRGQASGQAQSGPCVLCNGPITRWGPSQITITALRGTRIPVCVYCYSEISPPHVIHRREGSLRRRTVTTREELVRLVRELAELTRALPMANIDTFLATLPTDLLPKAVTLYGHIPARDERMQLFPGGWIEIIAAADLLDMEQKGRIGIWCTAEDGHPCRSISEKVIDDWLYRHRVPHKVEPPYPFDAELNPSGMRADFGVRRILVEFFGLMGREEYAAKAAVKRQLAAKHKLTLVELFPEDLTEAGLQVKLGALVRD